MGAGEPLRFPQGVGSADAAGGRPGGQHAPALWGAALPHPAGGVSAGKGTDARGLGRQLGWLGEGRA